MVGHGHQHIALAAGTVDIAGQRGRVAQAAGLEVGGACKPALAAPQRAFHADDGHGGDELGHHGRDPGVLQHLPQSVGRDAGIAAQACAVVHHGLLGIAPARGPPLCQRLARGVEAGHAGALHAQGEQHMLGHDVVAVFVDVAHHLGQSRRLQLEGRQQALGHAAVAYGSGELAAQLAPHAFYGLGRKALGLRRCDGPALVAAACRIAAVEGDALRIVHVQLHLAAPVAAIRSRSS